MLNKKQINEFLIRLEGKEGCNFKEKIKGKPESMTWKCKGGMDQTFAKKILKAMKVNKKDSDAFLLKCTELGGHCDCEILMNATEELLK